MSINSTNTETLSVGNGATLSFPIGFEYTDIDEIKVSIDGVIDTNFVFDNSSAPTSVIFPVAPAVGEIVRLFRETQVVQPVNLVSTQNYSDAAEGIEAQLDRLTQMIQEVEAEASAGSSNIVETIALFPEWTPSTTYIEGQVIKSNTNESFFRATQDFISDLNLITADIMIGYLEPFNQGAQGLKGDKGDKGEKGDTGSAGSNGLNGATGANGIFSTIATQANAEAGTNNVVGMTPLRTKQAFDTFIQPTTTLATTRNDSLNSQIGVINTELNLLRASISINTGRYSGSKNLLDNVTTPVELTADNGVDLKFNGNGTEFAKVDVYIKRGASRFSSFVLLLHYVNGVWLMTRQETFILEDTLEVDGITLSISTNGSNESVITYESDAGIGPFNQEENYMVWLGQEIPKGVTP